MSLTEDRSFIANLPGFVVDVNVHFGAWEENVGRAGGHGR